MQFFSVVREKNRTLSARYFWKLEFLKEIKGEKKWNIDPWKKTETWERSSPKKLARYCLLNDKIQKQPKKRRKEGNQSWELVDGIVCPLI